jgi:glutathione S-transferase
MDSPFVRRVAIVLHHYGLAFERETLSVYDDFTRLLAVNPLGKVPALRLDDGTVLADSGLILDYLDRLAGPEKALLPQAPAARAPLLAHLAVAVGLAEKTVEYRGETVRRPADKVDEARIDRVQAQIAAALGWLEGRTPDPGFITGEGLSHADIASAAAVTFIANKNPEHLASGVQESESAFPNLIAHTARCETLDVFRAAPFAED